MRRQRLVELDVLRGFAVAVMILVTSPGSWAHTYAQLQHAAWHGWTFADFVFPDFLFGVGMALGLSFGRSLNPVADRSAFWLKVGRRCIGLVLLGLVLNAMYSLAWQLGAPPVGPEGYDGLRLPGILQRIAFAYLIAILVLLVANRRSGDGQLRPRSSIVAGFIALCLLGYWGLLTFVPAPGFAAGDLTIAGNLPGYVDRQVFGTEHMWPMGAETWRGPILYDPEGILSTFPASVNVLFGVLAARIWETAARQPVSVLAGTGVLLVAAGLLLDPVFPINKKLWTSSFALLTSGLSFLALATVAAVLSKRTMALVAPLRVLGGNAILAFSMSIVAATMASIPLPFGGEPKAFQQLGFEFLSKVIVDPYLASLTYAACVLAVIYLLILPLDRRGIHLRL